MGRQLGHIFCYADLQVTGNSIFVNFLYVLLFLTRQMFYTLVQKIPKDSQISLGE